MALRRRWRHRGEHFFEMIIGNRRPGLGVEITLSVKMTRWDSWITLFDVLLPSQSKTLLGCLPGGTWSQWTSVDPLRHSQRELA
jgi:hypothetical protein